MHDETAAPSVTDLHGLIFAIAYRMLGSVAEAEDVVQEAFLRMHRAETEGTVIESRRAFLISVATRLAIDHFRSARVRREAYPGPWLPAPLVDAVGPGTRESLSMALLVLLETLSPVERAVFVLREAFDYDYDEIATIVEKSEQNCRQIFTRAKRHIEARKPRFEASRQKRDDLARRFFAACDAGNLDELVRLLAADATFVGDNGGRPGAVIRPPVTGSDRVVRLMAGFFAIGRRSGGHLELVDVNGQPGALGFDGENRLVVVMTLDIVDETVTTIRSVVSPEKLRHLHARSAI
jgi:RNA polymerase sigma-70 factor (ECF subfamily)